MVVVCYQLLVKTGCNKYGTTPKTSLQFLRLVSFMQATSVTANNQRNLKAFAVAPLNSPQEQLVNWSGNTHLSPATNGSWGRLPTDILFNDCVKMILEMKICPPWRLSHGEKSQRKSLRRASDHATDSTSCSVCAVMIQNFLVQNSCSTTSDHCTHKWQQNPEQEPTHSDVSRM